VAPDECTKKKRHFLLILKTHRNTPLFKPALQLFQPAFAVDSFFRRQDIKPANLLINSQGFCKVADFGIYRELDSAGSANAHTFVGSLSFMSPERITGGVYGCPADVWSLGLTLMTVALGRCPVNDNGRGYWALLHEIVDKPPPTLPAANFTAAFADFLARMLEADPTDRWGASRLLGHEFLASHGFPAAEPAEPWTEPSAVGITRTASGYGSHFHGHVEASALGREEGDQQRAELRQIVEALAKRSRDVALGGGSLPWATDEKIEHLAAQMDMSAAEVRLIIDETFDGEYLPRITSL
jgi:serine/threonine protein kinase